MVIDDDFLSTSIHSEMEDGFYLKVQIIGYKRKKRKKKRIISQMLICSKCFYIYL